MNLGREEKRTLIFQRSESDEFFFRSQRREINKSVILKACSKYLILKLIH